MEVMKVGKVGVRGQVVVLGAAECPQVAPWPLAHSFLQWLGVTPAAPYCEGSGHAPRYHPSPGAPNIPKRIGSESKSSAPHPHRGARGLVDQGVCCA